MAGSDSFRFDGKRALVVGGASGMGGATSSLLQELGADVIVMDYAPVSLAGAQAIKVDLRDKDSIDAAVDSCEGPIHALVSCAGVAPGAPGIERVNFIGQRHLIERMLDQAKLPSGSAIAMISSIGGYGWEFEVPTILDYLDTPDFESAVKWIEDHPDTAAMDYSWSKQTVCGYVGRQALPLFKRGIRINAVLPGTIDTPLAKANDWLKAEDDWRAAAGIDPPTPDKIAYPLAFLCSDAANYVNGAMLVVDGGLVNASIMGVFQGDWVRPFLTSYSQLGSSPG
jgi:NAD(P)-dependent dehydrogenase (short-subunit alcohol dehydrogenase family)